jgi:hypothetical protein
MRLEEMAARRDAGKRAVKGEKGERGARGERGPAGPKGPAGKPAEPGLTIRSWQIDAARYRTSPLISNGSIGAMLELREMFEAFLAEVGWPS